MVRSKMTLRAAAAAALLLVTACGGGDGSGGAGGTIVVGMRSDFGGFNPITSDALYSMELMNYALFTPLIQYDENLQPRPWLAESWVEEGDTAVVFRLRTDVTWHDGQRVTAEDVKFTFDRARLPESASLIGSAFLSNVESATVIDSFTIRFDYARPHAQALEDFWWAPAPKHLLEGIAPADMRNAPYNRAPVGSGPFRLTAWEANRQLVIEPYEGVPESLGGPPAARRIVFRIIPEASTLLTELVTGGVHVDIPVMPDQVNQIQEGASTNLLSFPGRTVYFIGWNNERAPFDDARVRRALALALNRQEIIDALLYGQGQIATSTVPPWHPLYPEGVEPLPHDPEAAAALLEEAGWTDTNRDGIRDKGGQPLSFELLVSDDALRRATAEVIQAQLRQVGAQANIRVTEFQTMLAAHRGRDFDAVFTNWVLDNFQVASAPNALLHSSQADIANSANRSSVRIPELDAVMERAAAASDPEVARQAWAEFTRILQREQPMTFMFWLNELAGVRDELSGVEMDPRGEFQTIRDWTLSR